MISTQVRADPGVALFLTRHPYRSRTTVEWRSTHASNHEPRFAPLCRFEEAATRKFGAESVAACPLYAMGQFLRRVGAPRVDAAFRETYDALRAYGLRRDQNVFPLALWNQLGNETSRRVRVCTGSMEPECAAAPNPPGPIESPGASLAATPGASLDDYKTTCAHMRVACRRKTNGLPRMGC